MTLLYSAVSVVAMKMDLRRLRRLRQRPPCCINLRVTMKKPIIFAVAILGLAFANVQAQSNLHGQPGTSYQRIGNTTFGSDGSSSQRIGNTTFGSDGSSSQRIGNTTFGSDGSSSQQIGNTLFNSNGSTVQRIGNTTFGSDGTTCQKIGSSTFCN